MFTGSKPAKPGRLEACTRPSKSLLARAHYLGSRANAALAGDGVHVARVRLQIFLYSHQMYVPNTRRSLVHVSRSTRGGHMGMRLLRRLSWPCFAPAVARTTMLDIETN